MVSLYHFNRIMSENVKLKSKERTMTSELDKFKRTVSDLTERLRIGDLRLCLARDVPPDVLGKGTAPRPSAALLRGQALINQNEVHNWRDSDYQDLPSREPDPVNEPVNEHDPNAGQPSSIAPIPTTDTVNVDINSNDVNLTEVSIIPAPLQLLSQSFLFIFIGFFDGG